MSNKLEQIYESISIESSLSRLWLHIQNRIPFAMVSWQRNGMSPSEEKVSYSELKNTIREMGYGYIELRGGYPEEDINNPGQTIDIDSEFSLFILKISLSDALKIGSVDNGFGPQDSILYSDGSTIALYSTNDALATFGSKIMNFKYGEGRDALPMGKKAVEQYFSKLVKGSHQDRKFAFVPENFFLEELGLDRKYPKYPNATKWVNWGIRVI
jgi:hypothetical protein